MRLESKHLTGDVQSLIAGSNYFPFKHFPVVSHPDAALGAGPFMTGDFLGGMLANCGEESQRFNLGNDRLAPFQVPRKKRLFHF